MTMTSQQYAGLASAAYEDRRIGYRAPGDREHVRIEGVEYAVIEHVDDARTGYQGTIFQRLDTHEIVVAHRGTEQIFKDGVVADGSMVFARTNPQVPEAVDLTRRALQYAAEQGKEDGHVPAVTVTGHSLGGTLAQVTAHHFDLRGETFNAYGAVSLGLRIPEGGDKVINHVMATDVVSAGSHHYGQERVYATDSEISRLQAGGFSNSRFNMLLPDSPLAVAATSLGDHSMHNFLNVDGDGRPDRSVLSDPHARALARDNTRMIQEYRDDVHGIRQALTVGARGPLGNAQDLIDTLRGPVAPGAPAREDAHGAALRLDHPAHAAFPLFRDASRGAQAQAASLGAATELQHQQLAGSLAARMHAAGGSRIDAVLVSPDGARTFGIQGRVEDPAHLRVHVDTAQAMNTPLVRSSEQAAQVSLPAQALEHPRQAQEPRAL